MPQISIIVPNYNTEKYLPRCLKSLVNQTFKDIEIIVIDDGSKDDSVKIMRQFAEKDNRIKVITQKNSGPATARNKGLDAATGKYLMFCDSDDWYEPNMCEVMFNTIEKKKTDIVCCHNFFNYIKKPTKTEKERLNNLYYNPKKSGRKKLTTKTITRTNILLWNKIWRHDLIKQYKIRFPDGHEADDDAFSYMYMCIAENIYFLRKPLYHYFMRSGSIMSTQFNRKPKNRYDNIFVANYILNFLFKNQLIEKHRVTISTIFYLELKYVQYQKFFTIRELISICQKMNQTIHNILGLSSIIVLVSDNYIFLLQKKSRPKLIYETIIRNIKFHFCKRNFIYWHQYIGNKLEWRHNKNLRKNISDGPLI